MRKARLGDCDVFRLDLNGLIYRCPYPTDDWLTKRGLWSKISQKGVTVVTVVTSSRCDVHLPGLPGLPGRGEAVKRRSRAVCKWTKWTKSTESSTQMQPELLFLQDTDGLIVQLELA